MAASFTQVTISGSTFYDLTQPLASGSTAASGGTAESGGTAAATGTTQNT